MEGDWVQLPAGRSIGAAIAVEIDRDGKSVWVFDRCGGDDCGKSNVAPIMKFDPTGKLVTSFGAGMFNFPHGIGVDREGNVYVTDERAKNGKGDVVVKFSPDGRVLMTLGKPGMPGDGPDTFHAPSDVAVAANGDIFVADGHGGNTNGRIVKFSKDGKFIKAWGKPGKAQGEFDQPHGIALDSAGPRLRRRSRQRPHPDLRSGRKLHRRVEAVRPAERGLHRPQRHAVRGRHAIGQGPQSGLPARRAHRQRQGWQGHGLHSRSRQPNSAPAKGSPPTIRATSFRATTASGQCGDL